MNNNKQRRQLKHTRNHPNKTSPTQTYLELEITKKQEETTNLRKTNHPLLTKMVRNFKTAKTTNTTKRETNIKETKKQDKTSWANARVKHHSQVHFESKKILGP